MCKKRFVVSRSSVTYANKNRHSIESTISATLHDGSYGSAIMLLGDEQGTYAQSIMCRGGNIFVFDPHSRSNHNALPVANGTSILVKFTHRQELVLYISQ